MSQMESVRHLRHHTIASSRNIRHVQFAPSPTDPGGDGGSTVELTSEHSKVAIPAPTDAATQSVAAVTNHGPGNAHVRMYGTAGEMPEYPTRGIDIFVGMTTLVGDFYSAGEMPAAMFVCGSSPGANATITVRYGTAAVVDIFPMAHA